MLFTLHQVRFHLYLLTSITNIDDVSYSEKLERVMGNSYLVRYCDYHLYGCWALAGVGIRFEAVSKV